MNAAIKATAIAIVLSFIWNSSSADDLAAKKPTRKPAKLPGMVIDFEKRCVDLEATVCLDDGFLELIACTQGSKEHESIVAVPAKAMHIHTALLLLGANNGNPAMRKPVDKEKMRWVNVPPRGDPIDVFLVTTNTRGKAIERPISDFIVRSSERIDEVDGAVITAPNQTEKRGNEKEARLPHTFIFAGSHLRDNGVGPQQYLADSSGNVISIATFGDELLCQPFHQTQENDALMWRIKSESLPKAGTKVTLRLRPKKIQRTGVKE
ncbi:MAG: YdjY domain-containing protein [Planctomycetota bacterium]|nr:YdjY domain-containing protein [Planctomycetota bacterium]